MTNYNKNLTRALAILSTEPEDCDITFAYQAVVVAGQHLYTQNDDDREVIEILMSSNELYSAVAEQARVMAELRVMRSAWCDAAKKLKQEAAA